MNNRQPQYLNLALRVQFRMADLIQKAAFGKGPMRGEFEHAPNWRNARAWGFHNWESAYGMLSAGASGDSRVWYTHCGEYFRDERDTSGDAWYTDEDCSEKAQGIIARLPHGRFIAGYRWTSNDERVWFDETYTDEDNACRAADNHAESFADMAREDSIRYNEAYCLDSQIDDDKVTLKHFYLLRNNPRADKADMRCRVRELIEAIRDKRETLKNDYSDIWS